MPIMHVGSHTVHYDDAGSGHPVLLLSGFGASRLFWWKQIGPLAKHFRVIAMDNCDAGGSGLGTVPYTIADLADHTAGVIRNLQLGPTHVVGISIGGFIAQELALRHPDLVERLVLVSTHAGGTPYVPADRSPRPSPLPLTSRAPHSLPIATSVSIATNPNGDRVLPERALATLGKLIFTLPSREGFGVGVYVKGTGPLCRA